MISTSTDLPAPIVQSLAPGMLSVPTPNFNYMIGAERYSMPRNGGTTLRFLRPRPLTPPVVALGNSGIEPAPQGPQRDILDATMSFYGTSVILNEQAVLQAQDPILSWVGERLAVAMREAEDIILKDYLMGSIQQYNCRGGLNGDNPTNLSIVDFSSVSQTLDTNNAFKFLNGKLGEDRYGSSPIRSAYFMFASTEIESQLDGLDPQFVSSWKYPNQNDTAYSEYGAVLNFRIFTSSAASVQRNASANGEDVFQNLCVAKESYAHIDQDGYSMQMIYRPPIFSGPLALNGTLGVKFAQAQIVLQSTWLRNMRCSALV